MSQQVDPTQSSAGYDGTNDDPWTVDVVPSSLPPVRLTLSGDVAADIRRETTGKDLGGIETDDATAKFSQTGTANVSHGRRLFTIDPDSVPEGRTQPRDVKRLQIDDRAPPRVEFAATGLTASEGLSEGEEGDERGINDNRHAARPDRAHVAPLNTPGAAEVLAHMGARADEDDPVLLQDTIPEGDLVENSEPDQKVSNSERRPRSPPKELSTPPTAEQRGGARQKTISGQLKVKKPVARQVGKLGLSRAEKRASAIQAEPETRKFVSDIPAAADDQQGRRQPAPRKRKRSLLREVAALAGPADLKLTSVQTISGLFDELCLTATVRGDRRERFQMIENLRQLAEPHGATVVEELADFIDALEDAGPRNHVVLIAQEPLRTEKYLHALAAGVPILRREWISECIASGSLVDISEYRVPAGDATVTQSRRPRALKNKARNTNSLAVVPAARRVFANLCATVRLTPKAATHRAESILLMAGAVVVVRPPLTSTPEDPVYLVTDKAPASDLLRRLNRGEVVAVTWDWLVECLITGSVVAPHEHASFQPFGASG